DSCRHNERQQDVWSDEMGFVSKGSWDPNCYGDFDNENAIVFRSPVRACCGL
ncbi:hypothetical protein BaRGS_00032948, partial [Batillaria attramentaria]